MEEVRSRASQTGAWEISERSQPIYSQISRFEWFVLASSIHHLSIARVLTGSHIVTGVRMLIQTNWRDKQRERAPPFKDQLLWVSLVTGGISSNEDDMLIKYKSIHEEK